MVSAVQAASAVDSFELWSAFLPDHWTDQQRQIAAAAYQLSKDSDDLAAASLLLDLHLDFDAVIAALLTGTVLRRQLSLEQLHKQFGPDISNLIAGVQRLSSIGKQQHNIEPEQLESLRKMLLSAAKDVRVMLITLAIKVCELRHLDRLPAAEQLQKARETLDIFAPLANRLGIAQFKWELEDRALRCLDPVTYKSLAKALYQRRGEREQYIQAILQHLLDQLAKVEIHAEVSGRAKHIYSIWKKMQRKRLPFEQIFDVHAVRVLVSSVADCYSVLGIVHAQWKNVKAEFDDYIANPKDNGYQSLHTAVIGPQGKTVEVQIRTHYMHQKAELGVAAHWRYKEGGGAQGAVFEQEVAWLRQLLEHADDNSEDFVEQLKTEVFQDRVYVLTPKGKIIDLPQGATALDFAYHIHTEIGHRCRGAKVDGRIVTLDYKVQNGEQISILTAKEGAPSRDWLRADAGYLKSARARAKVRHWFRQLDRDKAIASGQEALTHEFQRLHLQVKDAELLKVAARYNFPGSEDLYAAIGNGGVTTAGVVSAVQELFLPPPEDVYIPLHRKGRKVDGGGDVKIRGVGDLLTQMAGCCKPVPYEPIVGFITQGRGVSIHRQDCANVLHLRVERLIEVDWGDDTESAYTVDVQIDTYDRPGLLRDISTQISNIGVNILALNSQTERKTGQGRITATLEINDLAQLSRVLEKINQLPNVIAATRTGR